MPTRHIFRFGFDFRSLFVACVCVCVAGLGASCDDDTQTTADDTASPDTFVSTDTGAQPTDTHTSDPDSAADADPDARPSMCDAPEDWQSTTINGWSVSVDARDGAWRVAASEGGAVVLAGPGWCAQPDAVRVSDTGTPQVNAGFGAFQIFLNRGLTWSAATAAPPTVAVDAQNKTISTRWATDQGEIAFTIKAQGTEDLWIGLEGAQAAGELSMACAPDEAFFGLGTQATGMDLRGGSFPLWTQEQGIGKPNNGQPFPLSNIPEAAYAPMGVLYSSAGYTAVIGHDAFSRYDLCESDAGRVILASYAAQPSFVLVAGDTPADRLAALTDRYTGRLLHDPPAWVFGPWNDAVGGPARLTEVRDLLRAQNIPSSAIWSEDWIGGDQSDTGFRLSYAWAWDPALYPDLPADVAALHAQGFAFLAYFNTFVPEPTAMWGEGVAGGFLVKDAQGDVIEFADPAFRNAALVDLTNPAALTWLKGYLTTAADDLAIDGWMADFSEWLPIEAQMDNGQSGWLAHNLYPVLWQRVNTEVFNTVHATGSESPNNWTFFARSGWASINGGTAGASPTMWGGDQNTDWGYDDGFPTTVPIATHAGLAGVAVFGTDIAGYTSVSNPPTRKPLFYRWSWLGVFHGIMRTHHGFDECSNWSFDRDPETLEHYRRLTSIRTLLYPYIQTLAAEARTTGLPLMRHPYLVEPTQRALWTGNDYSFFFGPNLWISPVLRENEDTRVVTLPGDGWWPLFGTVAHTNKAAGDTITVPAPLTELPALVRPGTILPLLYDVVDSFYGATDPAVSDLSDMVAAYRLALYPAPDGALHSTTIGAATISGTGWPTDAASVDWLSAEVNGQPVSSCADPVIGPCVDPLTPALLVEGFDLTITAGGATLTILNPSTSGPTPRYRIAIAAHAWFPFNAPTALTQPDPDVPPPCE